LIPAYCRPYYTAPKHGRSYRKEKKEASNVSAKNGMKNTASCMERQTDEQTNAEGRQRTNVEDIVAVAHCFRWKWGGHVARMDKR
jgi:hypothetical protein